MDARLRRLRYGLVQRALGDARVGLGVPKDVPGGTTRLRRGCELGSAASCSTSGSRMIAGEWVPEDLPQALELLELGCHGESTNACRVLGERYHAGVGVVADPGARARICKRPVAVETRMRARG